MKDVEIRSANRNDVKEILIMVSVNYPDIELCILSKGDCDYF